ncbi:protein FAM184B isoform X1 [Trachemys scripta elegans]|uniref:protein FAM184B isoform X1 n=1 Tax=Trachemys scripta elegans TaxID=31138 RepID=UPI001557B06C|nr:protein FAM184B isoform X1 [Trachemys scripta elegans]
MASGINKIHQPGTCNEAKAAHCSSTEECNQELHLKMCKKIAQLTKVIYALNTKNDEHEASIQALKEAHQEEIQRILAETRETILQYKCKVGEEQELRKHIQTLEDTLEQHTRLKEEALAEFTMCKKQVEEKAFRTEANHTERIITLSKEMLDTKTDFENKPQHFNQESESLVNECKPFRQEKLDKKETIDEKRSIELQALINEMENLKRENQKITEEYAQKASKLQASYKKEKETLKKAMQQSVADTQKQCQQRATEQKKSSEAQEAALRQQAKKLEAELEVKGQKINELKKHSQKLKERMQDLEIQLKESQQETLESKSTVQKLEEELTVAKERLMLQENEILSKAEEMETVLNSQSKAEKEVDELKNQIIQLQQMTCTKQSQTKEGSEATQVLTQPMEAAATEIEDIKQRHKEELHKIKRQSDEEKMRLKEQLVKGLEDLVKKHTMEIKSAQTSMEAERKTLQKEVQIQLEELRKNAENEIKQLEKEKEALSRKLQDSSLEVLRLEDFIRQNQDIPRYKEFLQSHSRKNHERQQESDSPHCGTSEVQDPFLQQKDRSKPQRERGKGQEPLRAQTGTRNEAKPRLENARIPRREDRQPSLTSLQKEKAKEAKVLQEEWHNQKMDLQAQVVQLKQTLDQQANNFKESLKEQTLQSSKEKEKLLQDLQDTIQQSQTVKAQLEASHQRALQMLEKSKNQELKEAEEHLKKKYDDSIKIQHQSHRLEVQALEEKAKKELQGELERIQKQQAALIETLRMELSEQYASCTGHKKQMEELQMELKNVRALKKQQVGSNQNQITFLNEELEKCQNEIAGLKKENSLLKDTMELLSPDLQKQKSTQLQDKEKQHRLLEEDLKVKYQKELDILKQEHRKEIQNMIADFSSAQAHLQAKIVSLETELKELEEKLRKRESRPEDMHLIGCLQNKLSEREEIIKQLTEGRKFQHLLLPSTESHRNRSFSFNPNPGCLTPSMKQKKLNEVPSRVVSVPNLASYAKNFLSCDLRSKRNAPPITKSTSLDQSAGCIRASYQSAQSSDSNHATRTQGNEAPITKDDQKQDPRHQEWFTKYFSF